MAPPAMEALTARIARATVTLHARKGSSVAHEESARVTSSGFRRESSSGGQDMFEARDFNVSEAALTGERSLS